jgi:hypothetical protein
VYHDLATHLEMLSCLNTQIYWSSKQNGTIKILPPLVVPISGSAHGLLQLLDNFKKNAMIGESY